jgi:hypothetical protein
VSTQINVAVDSGGLREQARQLQKAARQAQLEKERTARVEQDATALRAQKQASGLTSQGESSFSRYGPSFKPVLPQEEPAARRIGDTAYYWLTVRAWWFDAGTFGTTPRPSAQLSDLAKVTTIRISGDGPQVAYNTILGGGNSVLELLNAAESNFSTFFGRRYLPEGTLRPTQPYISQMEGPRKTLEDAEPGDSEFDPTKYTVLHRFQLPIFDSGTLTFYKPFFNIYKETLDSTKIAFATQPKKFLPSGSLTLQPSSNHGESFNGSNSTLFDVNHAYLIGKFEAGTQTVKPRNTSREVHVFVREGADRNGNYVLVSSGNSRFAADDVVYWNNYSLYSLEPTTYRYGTIKQISRGTFTYSTDDFGGTASRTGLRIVLELASDLTLAFGDFSELSNSAVIATFASVESALDDPNAFWIDRFRLVGGFQNQWVVKTIDERDIPLPAAQAAYIGNSALEGEGMDCSKGGKAYFIQSSFLAQDTPQWRNQENYHDGDVVAQRPGLASTAGSAEFQSKSVRVTYIELNCATNIITRRETITTSFASTSNATVATIEGMPSWFPSKRYRQAGYSGQLNLNKTETIASRISTVFDPTTQTTRQIIKYWPLDQALTIQELVQMVRDEANHEEIDITASTDAINEAIDVPQEAGPTRWGYTYTTGYLVSL